MVRPLRDSDDPNDAWSTWTTPGVARTRDSGDGAPHHERYEVICKLGRGSTADVYRVRDLVLDRPLAMKVLHRELTHDLGAVTRFNREARTLARLLHPHIVPLIDLGTLQDGRPWFTMREVEGRPLTEHVLAQSPLRPTLRQLLLACDGVAHAHQQGIVHRDLKPDNIVCGGDRETYVVDWGLSGLAWTAIDELRVAGTPAFMSPEQAAGAWASVGPQSDVYALGATLYAILAGHEPFAGWGGPQVLQALIAGQSPELQPVQARTAELELGDELVHIMLRAMDPRPSARFEDASELADEVDAWLDGARRYDEGLRMVALSRRRAGEAANLHDEADAMAARAEAQLARIPAWAEEAEKQPAWSLLDEAALIRREARQASGEAHEELRRALQLVPDLGEAHAIALEHARGRHERAELARDADEAAEWEGQIRHHAGALPHEHPARSASMDYLTGTG